MAPLKHSDVATSFIFRFPADDAAKKPQVALFRRSSHVNTYHMQAFLEALRRLTRILSPQAGIKIDWEHEGYEWFDPDAINDSEGFESVPRILEGLRRVWFNLGLGEEAGNTLNQGLVALQEDHESGARQLATKALDTYIDVIAKLDFTDRVLWWKNVRFVGWHLWKNGRESMGASILNVVLSTLDIVQNAIPPSGPLDNISVDNILQVLRNYARDRQNTTSRTSATFQTFIEQHLSGGGPLKILTLSSSSTITSAITYVIGNTLRPVEVRVLESRPLFEGVKMAQSIASCANNSKAKTRLIIHTDASVGVAAKDIDVVLIGADLIDKTAAVSNKVGSLPTVLTAKYVSPKAKIVALSEKEKVLPFAPPGQEENDPCELMQAWGDLRSAVKGVPHSQVIVKNVYFEWVPSDLIDHYITEDGVTGYEGILNYAQEVGKKADQYFTNL